MHETDKSDPSDEAQNSKYVALRPIPPPVRVRSRASLTGLCSGWDMTSENVAMKSLVLMAIRLKNRPQFEMS